MLTTYGKSMYMWPPLTLLIRVLWGQERPRPEVGGVVFQPQPTASCKVHKTACVVTTRRNVLVPLMVDRMLKSKNSLSLSLCLTLSLSLQINLAFDLPLFCFISVCRLLKVLIPCLIKPLSLHNKVSLLSSSLFMCLSICLLPLSVSKSSPPPPPTSPPTIPVF